MTHQPSDATTTRHLLTALAIPPPDELTHTWATHLRDTTRTIQAFLLDAQSSATETVPFTVLHQWRTTLDSSLAAMRQAKAELWRHHRHRHHPLPLGRPMTHTLHVIIGPYAAAPLAAAPTQLLHQHHPPHDPPTSAR
ncbi:MAG: hypothetical protein WBF75_16805 [Pseudonocardiaceae bacterium]